LPARNCRKLKARCAARVASRASSELSPRRCNAAAKFSPAGNWFVVGRMICARIRSASARAATTCESNSASANCRRRIAYVSATAPSARTIPRTHKNPRCNAPPNVLPIDRSASRTATPLTTQHTARISFVSNRLRRQSFGRGLRSNQYRLVCDSAECCGNSRNSAKVDTVSLADST